MRRRPWTAAVVTVAAGVVVASAPGVLPLAAGNDCNDVGRRDRAECRRSVLPPTYPVSDMGRPDFGGGTHFHGHGGRSIDRLTGPRRTPDHVFRLTAARERVRIGNRTRRALAYNHLSPGPVLRVTQGDLVKVVLRNRNIREGTTIHWHGVDLSGRNDGVAGVTQDAVLPGRKYVYRFVVPDAGTYWYHSHQQATRQVAKGLIGTLVVQPRRPAPRLGVDQVATFHTYGATPTLNGRTGTTTVAARPGSTARVRLVNTDYATMRVAASGPFRVVAIDGFALRGPTPVSGKYVSIPPGGRYDLTLPIERRPVRVGVLGGPSLVVGPPGSPGALKASTAFDPLVYGRRGPGVGPPDRRFRYIVGQRQGFLDGQEGNWYTINGRTIPFAPMFMVKRGDTVQVTYGNRTAVPHPMHLHGHHALVVSRNGRPATGSPLWVDSLDVNPGEEYVLRFVADNPGIWMFHCHNLPHVVQGLMTHLTYKGVRTPYRLGRRGARLVNVPE